MAAALLVGCAHSSPPSGGERCVAGRAIPCTCPGGNPGAQVCAADGIYGVCECAAPVAAKSEVTCAMAGEQIFVIGMRMAEQKIAEMPDGEEKEQALRMMDDMRHEGRKKLVEEFVKECHAKAYSLECLECIVEAESEVDFERSCEKLCEPD
jgi:hypothetical protein